MTSLEDRLRVEGDRWRAELRPPSLDQQLNGATSGRRRPPTWLLSAACVAVALAVATTLLVAHWTGRTRAPTGEPAECPRSYLLSSPKSLYVPSSPRGIASSQTLVPRQTPDNVLMCQYRYPDGTKTVPSLALTKGRDLSGSLAGFATELSWVPRSVPNQFRHCNWQFGSADRYLLGLNYPLGLVWVSVGADPGRCTGATNGSFTTPVNLGTQVAASFATGHWAPVPTSSPAPCAGSPYGRLGEDQQLVPAGATSVTVCAADHGVPHSSRHYARGFGGLVAALNALPIWARWDPYYSPAYGPLEAPYYLRFSYPTGPEVVISIVPGTEWPISNGIIQTSSAGSVVDLVRAFLP